MKDGNRVEGPKAEDNEEPLEEPEFFESEVSFASEPAIEVYIPSFEEKFNKANIQQKLALLSSCDNSSFSGKEKGLMKTFMLLKTSTEHDPSYEAAQYLADVKNQQFQSQFIGVNTIKKALVMLNDNDAPTETRIYALRYVLEVNGLANFHATSYGELSDNINSLYKDYTRGKRPPPPSQPPQELSRAIAPSIQPPQKPPTKWVVVKTRSNTAPATAPVAIPTAQSPKPTSPATQSAIEGVAPQKAGRKAGLFGKGPKAAAELIKQLEEEEQATKESKADSSPKPPSPRNRDE